MPSPRIHEDTLRRLWFEQSRDAAGLHTTSGLPVEVLHPGEPNHDAGPDFVDAALRIGNVLYGGDVEIHVHASSWAAHHHGDDPHYNRVILHVAMIDDAPETSVATKSGRHIPLLLLSTLITDHADALPPLILSPGQFLKRLPLPCLNAWHDTDDKALRDRLAALGEERIASRCSVLEDRLRDLLGEWRRELDREEWETNSGTVPASIWEELLYEGLFEAMGYGKNSRPFLALARSVRLSSLRRFDLTDRITVQAVLFGAAGLLPPPNGLPAKESRARVRLLRRRWKELRSYFRVPLLHEGEWLFFRLRPANFPTARLAVCAHLLQGLFAAGSVERLFPAIRRSGDGHCLKKIKALFRVEADEYWSEFLHFRQSHPNRGISLGDQRFRELVVNTVVPLAFIRGRMEQDDIMIEGSRRFLRSLPAPPVNAATRPVAEEILGGGRFRSALEDQGALALVAGWCRKGKCGECPLKDSQPRPRLSS
jgi:hypothetical protein